MRQDEFDKYVDKAIRCDTTARSAPAGPLPVMTPDKLARLTALLAAGRENVWYNSGVCQRRQHEVLTCQKARLTKNLWKNSNRS